MTGMRQQRLLRVAAYCRVSNDYEATVMGLEMQKNHFMERIAANPEWTLASIYADESRGSTQNRMAFRRMLQECRRGTIDVILVNSISRFGRDLTACVENIRELQELGVAVIFEKEKINTLNVEGNLRLAMMNSVAQSIFEDEGEGADEDLDVCCHGKDTACRRGTKPIKVSYRRVTR